MATVGKKRKSGTTYYVATFWNGRQYWERSGTDKREADRLDARRLREVAAGTFSPEAVAPKSAVKTVADYAALWLAERTNVSASDDRRNVARFLAIESFAAAPIAEVRPRHIIAALKQLATTGISDKTRKNAYGSLRTMFRDAVINEHTGTDPCTLPRNFFSGTTAAEREVYTRAEAAVLVSHKAIPSPIRVLNALCLLGGLREGEACGRRWRDLDPSALPLWAMAVATQYDGRELKTRKPRSVPVHPELAAILQAWAEGDFFALMRRAPLPDDYIVPYVSARAHGFYTRSIYYKAFQAACTAAGVRARSLHSTRHTMVTMARRGGADRQVLSKVTHNAKGEMIDRYTHHDWEPLCNAVLAIGSLFDARPTPHGIGGIPEKTGSIKTGTEAHMLAESNASDRGALSSIPGASTDDRAELGSNENKRQSRRQSTVVGFDGLREASAARRARLELLSEADPELAAPGLAACRALDAAYDGDPAGVEVALADMAAALGGRS
jgi:integrase